MAQPHLAPLTGVLARIDIDGGPPPPFSLPVNDDLLSEILLRLPPQPSSLPRASLVCKAWYRIVSDPDFLRRFRSHHRKPPLLGYFGGVDGAMGFTPVLDPPDRIPAERFPLPVCELATPEWKIISCRHGLVLFLAQNWDEARLLVWDPVTGHRRSIDIPREIEDLHILNCSVLCVAGDPGHVHGGCFFKMVLLATDLGFSRFFASVYTSETGIWSDIISAPFSPVSSSMRDQSILVGNSLYWLSDIDPYDVVAIAEFDLDKQNLAKIDAPADIHANISSNTTLFKSTEGDGLGLLVMSEYICQSWKMEVSYGVARWVPWETIDLEKLLLSKHIPMPGPLRLMGFVEDHNAMILWSTDGIFMVQLEPKQIMRISDGTYSPYDPDCHPFTTFYLLGT